MFLAGTALGRYEIVEPLGAGGMGVVYKARDPRLERTVAIKVLSDQLSADSRFHERFEREARAIARLTHSNICRLHDVSQVGGRTFLVMEYLEGETLAARLARDRPLSIQESLDFGLQLIDALDHAHRLGIVHRDLKPGNVMLTKSGAKLLDFGLARASEPGGSVSTATTTGNLTGPGALLGTLPYMSPEQLEGRNADARSDLFAFGCVLYEMLTGRAAFAGESPASLLTTILRDDPPPIASFIPGAPTSLDRILRTCLAKSPDERWQTATDLRRQLTWTRDEVRGLGDDLPIDVTHAGPGRSLAVTRAAWVTAGMLLGVGIAGAVAWRFEAGIDTGTSVTRSTIDVEPGTHLLGAHVVDRRLSNRPSPTAIALTRDGRTLAYVAANDGPPHLYLRNLDSAEAVRIPNTAGADVPFFSPDGAWIGFWADGALRKADRNGGVPVTIGPAERITGADWLVDDTIVYAGLRTPILRVAASGGAAAAVTTLDQARGEISHRLPRGLPGAELILFTSITAHYRWSDATINTFRMSTGDRRTLFTGASDAHFVSTGHLLVAQAGSMLALPFNSARLAVTGGPVSVLDDVMHSVNGTNTSEDLGAAQFAVAENGSMAYVAGGVLPATERALEWVDRAGRREPIGAPSMAFIAPRLSRDARRIAVQTMRTLKSPARDVWMYDLDGRAITRVATESAWAAWHPDRARVAFTRLVGGIEQLFWAPADGSTAPEPLVTNNQPHVPGDWTPDGRTLVYLQGDPPRDLWTYSLPEGIARPLLSTTFDEAWPALSPDGKWLAYSSNETGQMEVYVRPFPSMGEKRKVSTQTGIGALWSRDGRSLYFMQTSDVTNVAHAVDVRTTPTFTSGPPRRLFEAGSFVGGNPVRMWDSAPDGRLLMVSQESPSQTPATQIHLVQNWFTELRKRTSASAQPASQR